MNVLFLTMLDFKSITEKGIYTDLMREFVNEGHQVCIVSPTEKRMRQPTQLIHEGNCRILKLSIGNIQKTNLLEKGISMLTLESKFRRGITAFFSDVKFDLIIYSTPPITLTKAVEYVKRRDQAKSYLLLKDIFPQNAVDLGILKKKGITSLLYRYFRRKERKLYVLSDYIGCMSKANVDYIIRHNSEIQPHTVEVSPNSISPSYEEVDNRTVTDIKVKYNIPFDKTVFIYGGNLGKPQGIDFLIEVLRSNRGNRQAFFVIVGAGTEYVKLKTFFANEKLSNARLFAQMPKEDYEVLVQSCDVGLIFLDPRFTIPNFPSRLLSYMQVSIPVLAATDECTDIGEVLELGRFGLWCKSGDIEKFNDHVQKLCSPGFRQVMGANARKYLEENYTSRHSYETITSHFIS